MLKKKIIFGALASMFAFNAIGFGGYVSANPSNVADKATMTAKTEATKAIGADKAILAYAQLYAYGEADADAIKAAGLTQKEIDDIQTPVVGGPLFGFAYFSLEKPNLESVLDQYFNNIKTSSKIKVSIKTDDPANPVVLLTAATIDHAAAKKAFDTNPDIAKITEKAATRKDLEDEHLFKDAEYQNFATSTLKKLIAETPFTAEKSIEIPCKLVEKNGKMYWAPKDISVIDKVFYDNK